MVRQHYRRHVWLTALLIGLGVPAGSVIGDVREREADHPLTSQPGDPDRGEALARDDRKGNCIICHALPMRDFPSDAFGDVGPPLQGVGSRLTVPELRQRIVNPKVLSPDTVMPAYFITDGLSRVQRAYVGRTILSAQEVEDLVAYLASLK